MRPRTVRSLGAVVEHRFKQGHFRNVPTHEAMHGTSCVICHDSYVVSLREPRRLCPQNEPSGIGGDANSETYTVHDIAALVEHIVTVMTPVAHAVATVNMLATTERCCAAQNSLINLFFLLCK